VARPPVFGGRVKSFDDKELAASQAWRDVFEIPLVKGTGVAVVADRFWAAKQARRSIERSNGTYRVWNVRTVRSCEAVQETSSNRGQSCGQSRRRESDGPHPRGHRIVAEYEFPYLAHAAMEPLNATIRFDGDRAEAWILLSFRRWIRRRSAQYWD